MHFVVGAVAALLGSIISFLVENIGKKFALMLAVIAVIAGFVTAFFIAIAGLLDVIDASAPPMFQMACSWVIPDNFPLVASTMATARMLRWAYEWNIKIAQMRLG